MPASPINPPNAETKDVMIYSFDLSDYEDGKFTATRYPDNCAVGGDWVCGAIDDKEAFRLAQEAAFDEWAAPETRDWSDFTVEFVDSQGTDSGLGSVTLRPEDFPPAKGTIAERVAALFGDDGSNVRASRSSTIAMFPDAELPEEEDEESGETDVVGLGTLCDALAEGTRDDGFDVVAYDFADGSVITIAAGAWDLGYPGCFCWQGAGHKDDCPVAHPEEVPSL